MRRGPLKALSSRASLLPTFRAFPRILGDLGAMAVHPFFRIGVSRARSLVVALGTRGVRGAEGTEGQGRPP